MNNKYWTIGSSLNPAIMFLHADSLDHRQWDQQLSHFAKKYYVITYDLPGYGQSAMPDYAFSHQQKIYNLITSLQLKKATLVGSSYGGEHAINFSLEHPDLVKALILVNTSLSGFPCSVNWDIGQASQSVERIKENWLNHEVFKYIRTQPKVYSAVEKIIHDYSGSHWFHRDRVLQPQPKAIDQLEKLTMPVLLIIGKNDLPYFHHIAHHIHSHTSNAEIVAINASSHLPNMENADEFNNLITKWIRQNE